MDKHLTDANQILDAGDLPPLHDLIAPFFGFMQQMDCSELLLGQRAGVCNWPITEKAVKKVKNEGQRNVHEARGNLASHS